MKLPKFYLEKPDSKTSEKIFEKVTRDFFLKGDDKVLNYYYNLGFSSKNKYIYWDDFKHSFKHKEKEIAWLFIKSIRKIKSKKTPIKSVDGNFFTYNELPDMNRFLHETDLNLGGNFSIGSNLEEKERKSIFLDSLSEEAISSAQLEGAHTTRAMAQKIIKEKKTPKNDSEKMILNNYKAMMKLESDFLNQKEKKLNIETLFDFHKILTHDVIQDNNFSASGRLRLENENIDVADDKYIYHSTPPLSFVKKELEKLIEFINDDLKHDFIHPVLKATMIHFWIGYLHPFYDGNGRMARLLFYLYLLKHNYTFFGYFPISIEIKKSVKKYAMSYVYSEQDDSDLTYFLDFNIEIIKRSEQNFKEYIKKLKKKKDDNIERDKRLEIVFGLNNRQIDILEYLNKSKGNTITMKVYVDNKKISRATGNKDLKQISNLNLVDKKRAGKEIKYYISKKGNEIMGN